ncbi:hypothetical protein HCH45_15430, partial [Sphingomonas melonis]
MSRELSVERHIEAPVAHVWKTMIDRFEEWFCPLPWRAEAREIAWRPGGRSLVVMHGPNGEEILNEGIILDFQPELSCPLLSGPSTMTVWIKEGTTNACQ